jgi:hypothetical protein
MSVSQIQNGEDILNLVNNHKGQTIQLSNEEVYEQIKSYYNVVVGKLTTYANNYKNETY